MSQLGDEWFQILVFCEQKPVDLGVLRLMQDTFTRQYKRLGYAGQGEFTHEISERLIKDPESNPAN
jgi:hypothetical protein